MVNNENTGEDEKQVEATTEGVTAGSATDSNEPEKVVAQVVVEPTELPIKATAERISTEDDVKGAKNQHPNDVKFKVKYSKDFKGKKLFEDGCIQIVSKESAEHFIKLGMGIIVK
jgi:hypothetical protein